MRCRSPRSRLLDTEWLRPKHGGLWHPETVRRMLANATDIPPAPALAELTQVVPLSRPQQEMQKRDDANAHEEGSTKGRANEGNVRGTASNKQQQCRAQIELAVH